MDMISPFSDNVEDLALAIDEAIIADDTERQGELLEAAIAMLEKENFWSKSKLYYCIAAIYGAQGDNGALDKDTAIRKQLYSFRQSISLIEDESNTDMISNPYIVVFSVNLYINYASVLSVCGRRIDAIRYYKKALTIDGTYGMALGNLGISYRDYSFLDYDPGHQEYFRYFSFQCLEDSLKCNNPNTYDEAKERFKKIAEEYGDYYKGEYLVKGIESHESEYEEKEYAYRLWGAKHGLFLNTMNDLPVVSLMFANDMLHLPNMIVDIDAKPVFHGLYNQIKQEYVYSRYLYYCATDINATVHYADKETHLKQFYDYPKYSIRVEQLKTSFKTLYGIFDKVAFFINSYFDLGIRENHVSFKSIWYTSYGSKANKYDYKNVLDHTENFALSALYWISRDFYESFEDSPNPELKRISQIRNALEHRYVKIVEDWFPERMSGEYDDLALYVSEKELIQITEELMHIVREVIICLSFAVNIEEKKKDKDTAIVMPVSLLDYDDNWKL